jgi:hypothetical protein
MTLIDSALARLDQLITKRLAERDPFRAIVTGTSGGMVTIRRLDAATGEDELRARLPGPGLAVDDEVLCLPVNGKPVILGPVQRSTPAATFAPSIVTFRATDATESTTEITNYVTAITTSVTLPEGTWSALVWRGASFERSVATGGVSLRLQIGGSSFVTLCDTADYGDMTQVKYFSVATEDTGIAGGGGVTVNFTFRGATTAGTTTLLNSYIAGFFYRVPA